MKRLRVLAGLLVAAGLVLSGCSTATSKNGDYVFHGAQPIGKLIPVADRKPANDFSGSLLNGGTYRLSKYAGKITIVNFWGTWCPPCRSETPQFQLVYNAYKAKGVTFVGIDLKEAGRDAPKAFVKNYGISYPIVYDEDGATALRLGNVPTQGLPFSMVLDSRHRVAAVYLGPLLPKDIEPVLNKLIAKE